MQGIGATAVQEANSSVVQTEGVTFVEVVWLHHLSMHRQLGQAQNTKLYAVSLYILQVDWCMQVQQQSPDEDVAGAGYMGCEGCQWGGI